MCCNEINWRFKIQQKQVKIEFIRLNNDLINTSITNAQTNMILYNVTVNIHESVQDQWLQWMQQTRIPAILATGKFSSAKIVKVLIEEEMGGTTYSIQFTTDSKATLDKYYAEDAPRFRQESYQLFGEKMLAFRTELELISEHK